MRGNNRKAQTAPTTRQTTIRPVGRAQGRFEALGAILFGRTVWPVGSMKAAATALLLITAWQGLRRLPEPGTQSVSMSVQRCETPVQVQPNGLVVCWRGKVSELAAAGLSDCCLPLIRSLQPGDEIACIRTHGTCRLRTTRMSRGKLQLLAVPIDPNRAGKADLESLPGIGPTLARAILDYRKLHGPFPTAQSLLAVPGIGPKTFEKIRSRVRISGHSE